jgi:hypothetical protein
VVVQPNMIWGLAGPVHIAVHGPGTPTDEEWLTYLADVRHHVGEIRGLIAHAPMTGSLTRAQRRAATDQWQRHGTTPRMAIMTGSFVARGIVSSIGWVLGTNVRAFAIDDFQGAGEHLRLAPDELAHAQAMIAALQAKLAAA